MFDLEQAITEWRRRMLAAAIKCPVPLEELESHLRDDVERWIISGLGAAQAFEVAAQRIGPAIELKSEFKKARSILGKPKETMKEKLISVLHAVVLLIGMELILPALAKWRGHRALSTFDVKILLLGAAVFTIGGVSWTVVALKSRKGRLKG